MDAPTSRSSPCPRCQRPVPFQTPQCPACGHAFVAAPGEASAGMRLLVPVGRTPLAIVAGYVGLVSLVLLPLAPVALALGIWAAVDLKRRPGKHGMGRAVFAIVAGALVTGITAVVVMS